MKIRGRRWIPGIRKKIIHVIHVEQEQELD